MSEHQHNHEHLVAVDENGNEIVFAVLQRFEANDKRFVLFAEEKEGGSEVQAAVIVEDAEGNEELEPVTDEADQEAVNAILEKLANEADDEDEAYITVEDANGNEITFTVVAKFSIGDKKYVAFVDENEEQPELQVATLTENESGEQGLAPVETEEEFVKVQEVLNEILSEEQ